MIANRSLLLVSTYGGLSAADLFESTFDAMCDLGDRATRQYGYNCPLARRLVEKAAAITSPKFSVRLR
jgi:hypothetical protein